MLIRINLLNAVQYEVFMNPISSILQGKSILLFVQPNMNKDSLQLHALNQKKYNISCFNFKTLEVY